MIKKIFLSAILGIVSLAGLASMALAGSQASCDRYYASSYWYPQNPSNRVCSQDYYTYEGWGNYGLNCSDLFTYSSYTSWKGFTSANGNSTSDSQWDYYIPWTEQMLSEVTKLLIKKDCLITDIKKNFYYYHGADNLKSSVIKFKKIKKTKKVNLDRMYSYKPKNINKPLVKI